MLCCVVLRTYLSTYRYLWKTLLRVLHRRKKKEKKKKNSIVKKEDTLKKISELIQRSKTKQKKTYVSVFERDGKGRERSDHILY